MFVDRPKGAPWPDPPPGAVVRLVLFWRNLLKGFVTSLVPSLALFEDSIGVASTQLLAVVVRLGLIEELEKGPASAQELGQRLGLSADPLHRALRALASRGYFALDRQGRFGNTRLSRLLLENHPEHARDFLLYFSSDSNTAAWAQLEEVLRTGQNGFVAAHGRSVWQHFADNPGEEAIFARQMQGLTYREAPIVASSYPFGEVASVCDVGGGQGGLISEIAIRHPHLRCALADLAGVVALAQEQIAARGAPVELVVADMFEMVPAGFELYILKNILHDWANADCIRILNRVRQAMSPASRVLVIELEQEPHRPHPITSLVDLQMMVVTDNGRERCLDEYVALMSAVGLRLWRHQRLPLLSWFEFQWV